VIADTGPCQSIRIDTLPGTPGTTPYTITGTTSLQSGTELLFTALPVEQEFGVDTKTKSFSGSISGATGMVTVTRGTGQVNTWSADIDISRLPPDVYLVTVSNDRIDPRTYGTIPGNARCSKQFTVPG
jgi:hypothetical protein